MFNKKANKKIEEMREAGIGFWIIFIVIALAICFALATSYLIFVLIAYLTILFLWLFWLTASYTIWQLGAIGLVIYTLFNILKK